MPIRPNDEAQRAHAKVSRRGSHFNLSSNSLNNFQFHGYYKTSTFTVCGHTRLVLSKGWRLGNKQYNPSHRGFGSPVSFRALAEAGGWDGRMQNRSARGRSKPSNEPLNLLRFIVLSFSVAHFRLKILSTIKMGSTGRDTQQLLAFRFR